MAEDLGTTLENLQAAEVEAFRRGHNRPGLRFLQLCPKPDVQPFSEKIEKGLKILTDKCKTCGATKSAAVRITMSGS